MKAMCNFSFASPQETLVAGAMRPGYPNKKNIGEDEIQDWIDTMQRNGVQGVVCLLPKNQLDYYAVDLLAAYREAFGEDMVCWAPVEDYYLVNEDTLNSVILPFLDEAVNLGIRVVVHCSAGSGRTGLVLAAWLVHRYDLSPQEALRTVENSGRHPREAIIQGNAAEAELISLLESARKKE